MHDRFGAKSPRARALRFHCQTAGMTLTAQQPHNNVVRVAVQALAAVLGGCQSLHTNSFDEALGLPTQQSATIALRTQQIIAHETGVAEFVDALAGSYAVESLTHRIEQEAKKYIDRIDDLGGSVSAIEQGYIQREIQNSAYQYQLDIEQKRRVIVGQNDFLSDTEAVPVLKVDPKEERAQADRLRAFRASRDESTWASTLRHVEAAARGTDNLVPLVLEAVKAGATVGEVSDTLRAVWGEYTEVLTI
jgi:methylmalonyl-CoA mutase N-terminal domain/subunit